MRHVVRSSPFLFLVVVGAFALGQTTPSNTKRNAKPPAVATATQSDGTAPGPSQSDNRDKPVSGFGTKLAQSVVNNTSDPDDHVRCFFTLRQLMELRPVPGIAKLTEADQSQVLTSVVEAVDSANDKELTADQKTKFIGVLAGDLDGQLVGKTPGEALATIMNILYQIKSKDQLLYESARDKSSIRQMILEEAGSEGNDFSQELQKKLDEVSKHLAQYEARLNDPQFMSKADPETKVEVAERLEVLRAQQKQLRAQLEQLGGAVRKRVNVGNK